MLSQKASYFLLWPNTGRPISVACPCELTHTCAEMLSLEHAPITENTGGLWECSPVVCGRGQAGCLREHGGEELSGNFKG